MAVSTFLRNFLDAADVILKDNYANQDSELLNPHITSDSVQNLHSADASKGQDYSAHEVPDLTSSFENCRRNTSESIPDSRSAQRGKSSVLNYSASPSLLPPQMKACASSIRCPKTEIPNSCLNKKDYLQCRTVNDQESQKAREICLTPEVQDGFSNTRRMLNNLGSQTSDVKQNGYVAPQKQYVSPRKQSVLKQSLLKPVKKEVTNTSSNVVASTFGPKERVIVLIPVEQGQRQNGNGSDLVYKPTLVSVLQPALSSSQVKTSSSSVNQHKILDSATQHKSFVRDAALQPTQSLSQVRIFPSAMKTVRNLLDSARQRNTIIHLAPDVSAPQLAPSSPQVSASSSSVLCIKASDSTVKRSSLVNGATSLSVSQPALSSLQVNSLPSSTVNRDKILDTDMHKSASVTNVGRTVPAGNNSVRSNHDCTIRTEKEIYSQQNREISLISGKTSGSNSVPIHEKTSGLDDDPTVLTHEKTSAPNSNNTVPSNSVKSGLKGVCYEQGKEEPYKCGYCGSSFAVTGQVYIHIRKKHMKTIEPKMFTASSDYTKVGEKGVYCNEKKELPFMCGYCGSFFSRNDQVYTHIRSVHEKIRFCCQQCGKDFRLLSQLKRHLTKHSDARPYLCPVCSKTYKTNCQLYRHTELAHPSDGTKKIVRTCKICSKGFHCTGGYNIHMKRHRNEKAHKCDKCEKSYVTKLGLQNHQNTHLTDRSVLKEPCKICGKAYYKSYIYMHMRSHTGEKKFECHICGKKFPRKPNLTGHLRSHTGEKPYDCNKCGKKFTLYSNMFTHRVKCKSNEQTVKPENGQ